MENRYLVCTNTEMYTINESFGLNFAKMIYTSELTDSLIIGKKHLETIDEIISIVLECTCYENEIKIVKEITGFLSKEQDKIKKVSKADIFEEDHISYIIDKVRRKLWHPVWSAYLFKQCSPCGLLHKRYSNRFYVSLKKRFISEIDNAVNPLLLMEGSIYLKAISNRYNFSIRLKEHESQVDDISIECLDISREYYWRLSRIGIKTLNEFIEFDKEKLRNKLKESTRRGDEIISEIEDYIYLYHDVKESYTDIIFTHKNEKIVFKCFDDMFFDEERLKIVQSIYTTILSIRPGKKTLFEPTFSPGLTEFLLLRGYLFLDDITNDCDELENCLESTGFQDFAKEIKLYKKYKDYKEEDEEKVVITPLYEELKEELVKNNCKTLEDILDYFNNNSLDSENAIYKLVETIANVFGPK